jgi:DNA-binding NarL/FixJ family response regulator
MDGRALLIGPAGTVRDLVGGLLALAGLAVELPGAPSASAAGTDTAADPDVMILVSPGPAEWDQAAGFDGGVVLVTERHPGDAEVVDAILGGADAVVHPDTSPAELLAALAAVRAGGTVLDPAQARRLARAARAGSARSQAAELRLTPREAEILQSAERGESVKQTARALDISAKTVENLQSRLFRKLGARNRAHAVALAHRFGLLADPDLLVSVN